MPRSTAIAHPNLAFVKYWGKVDFDMNLPTNGSISMNLSAAETKTSVWFDGRLKDDTVIVSGEELAADDPFAIKVSAHLDRVRKLADIDTRAKVETENNFPQGAGFASSASGFAALTVAAVAAAELELDEKALSRLARAGSGSACRSIPNGFAEWLPGMDDETSYAIEVAPADHWGLRDVAVVVSTSEKGVSSTQGHKFATRSPYWNARKATVIHRLNRVTHAIKTKNFDVFGRELEAEAIEMHAVALTSPYQLEDSWVSGIYYIEPATLELMRAVQNWRADGLPVYYTLDAGPTVHLLCEAAQEDAVREAVATLQGDRDWQVFVSAPAAGARLVEE
ncbi:MAG: diphosphomevalonate decarboxylase [Chloroflexota bacterium]